MLARWWKRSLLYLENEIVVKKIPDLLDESRHIGGKNVLRGFSPVYVDI